MWWWHDVGDGLERGFTDRCGGASEGPYAGLNLGGHVGDEPDSVRENRAMLAEAIAVAVHRLVLLSQVHGDGVVVVTGDETTPPTADAVITAERGLALAVLVADCTPVLLHDLTSGLVAAVHAGRPGLRLGVVTRTVEAMRDLGARDISAVVGPSVCGRCYEVPSDMRADVAASAPSAHTVSWSGTPALDVAAGVVEQLAASSVAVQWVPGCTREEPRLYSYRRDRVTGRFAGVVVRR